MSTPIKLIVGLGNPGPSYSATRHNAGYWLIEALAAAHHLNFKSIASHKVRMAEWCLDQHSCYLVMPTCFMNESGLSIRLLSNFYKLLPQEILIAHDELALNPGIARLKIGGGHAGHNGLRDIITHLHTQDFYRLRLGIGHPGTRTAVTNYVLSKPSNHDNTLITAAITASITVMPQIVMGHIAAAMQELHTAT